MFEVEEKNKGKVVFDTCVVEYGDDMLDFALVSMSSTLYSDEKWILDICCTDHMCLIGSGSLTMKNKMMKLFSWAMIVFIKQLG